MDVDGPGETVMASGPVRRRATVGRSLCLGGLSLLSASLVLWTTRDGVSTSADSSVYVGTARSVAAGQGLTVPIHYYPLGRVSIGTPPPGRSSPRPTPLVIYAPLAPILLAAGARPFGAARVEDTIFFALTILVAGMLVLATTDELWLAAAAQLVLAFSLVVMASSVGTLCAALFFAAVAITAVLRHLVRPRVALLVVAAAAIGLATLERYASGGLIIWGVLALRHRRRDALALVVLSSCPLAGWFLYEQFWGRSTGHFVGFHIVKSTIRSGIRSVADWILPTAAPFPLAVLGALAVVIAVALLLRTTIVARTAVLFIAVQIVILEIAITFFDAGVNLEPSEFIPIFFALVIAAACSVSRSGARKSATRVAAIALVVAAVARFGVDNTTHPTTGYATPAWAHSPIMADVRALPSRAVIYTNAPDAIYLLVHRATASIPETVDFSTLKANSRYDAQLGEIRRTLTERPGYVVYVRGLGREAFLPTEASLRQGLDLQLVGNAPDGAVYAVTGGISSAVPAGVRR